MASSTADFDIQSVVEGPSNPHLTLKNPTEVLISPQRLTLSPPFSAISPQLHGKTVVITGGASGIGEATARQLVSLGANVIIGDINVQGGRKLVESLEHEGKGNKGKAVFYECNVMTYDSQVEFFKKAAEWAKGKINCVVVNAGISEHGPLFEEDDHYDYNNPPPPPNLITFNVNFIGALYTVRLAHHFLRHNNATNPTTETPDRHILLIGSYSAFLNSPVLPLYSTAKHGLLGLFSSLRMTSLPHHHIRINLICPYFVQTPIMPAIAKILLAGQQTVSLDHLVGVICRVVADKDVMGRMIAVGPEGWVEDVEIGGGLEEVESYGRRVVKVLNNRYWGKQWWERWGRILKDVAMVIIAALWMKVVMVVWGRW